MNLGTLLKQKRQEKDLTLIQLGEKIGVANGTISKWERGQIKNMRIDKVKPLTDILGIDPLLIINETYKTEKDD